MTMLGLVGAIPLALLALGLWLALDAMRRRAGIPMLAGEPSRSASNDMLIAGLGIAGIAYAITPLNVLALRGTMPRTPMTTLNDVVPALSAIPSIPMNAVMTVALIGIPLLVIAGVTQRWALRLLIAAALVALMGVVGWAVDPEVSPVGAMLVIAIVATVSIGIAIWGALSAWSWIVAALAYQALNGLRGAAYGAAWQDRAAAGLLVLAAGALIALIARRTARGRVQADPGK
jgi:hypothetical protein